MNTSAQLSHFEVYLSEQIYSHSSTLPGIEKRKQKLKFFSETVKAGEHLQFSTQFFINYLSVPLTTAMPN